jgi:hypothetical protein
VCAEHGVNVLFLSPHFPPQYHLFCKALKKEGVTVLGLGDAPAHALSHEVHESLSAYFHIHDMNRYDEVMRAVGYLIFKHGRIDRLDSLNEHWLELEARLREDFNVVGQRPADTARNRSKTRMRDLFKQANLASSEGERLTSSDHAWALAAKFGYPLVLKPDVGVGAARTFRVDNEQQLKAALQEPLEGYVVERFERGPLTSFDGLTDRDGRIVFATSHVFSAGIMEIVNSRLTMHYYSRRAIPPVLEEAGRKIVEAFGVKERFFHVELFEAEGGGYRALEINVRPPGGFTTDMMNFGADIDIYQLWADVVRGKDLRDWKYERRFHCAHVGRRSFLHYALDHHQVLELLGDRLVMQGEMPPVLSAAMGEAYYMFRDPDEESLRETIAAIEQLV